MVYTHSELAIELHCTDDICKTIAGAPHMYDPQHERMCRRPCTAFVSITANMAQGAVYTLNKTSYTRHLDRYDAFPYEISTPDATHLLNTIIPTLRDSKATAAASSGGGGVNFNRIGFYLGHIPLVSVVTRLRPDGALIGIPFAENADAMCENAAKTQRYFCSELIMTALLCIPVFNEAFVLARADIDTNIQVPSHSTPDDCYLLFSYVSGGQKLALCEYDRWLSLPQTA